MYILLTFNIPVYFTVVTIVYLEPNLVKMLLALNIVVHEFSII